MAVLLSIVVPVLRDTTTALELLNELPEDPAIEVIFADGDYDRDLEAGIIQRSNAQLIRSAPGRGTQLNVGAAAATGRWLWFVHADSHLPDGWLSGFRDLSPEYLGGWFRFALDDDSWQARWLERLVAWRVKWLGLPYGDQGLFVQRQVFEDLGGYAEWPLMEDVDFVRRLQRRGPVAQSPLALTTSARRWRQDGWWRRSLRNVTLLLLFEAGVSPARLARWYKSR